MKSLTQRVLDEELRTRSKIRHAVETAYGQRQEGATEELIEALLALCDTVRRSGGDRLARPHELGTRH